MAGALLRTGTLREFKPLGAVGSPVYSAASQLRAAVRRQLGDTMADLFAIPRQHDDGDRIDWYSPRPGDVIPWSAATPDQRSAAKATLLAARERLAAHSRTLQADERSERQVFGRLLALATDVPGEEHIYIVNGQPVLTFWGFHPAAAPAGFDAVGNLDPHTTAPTSAPQPPAPPPFAAPSPRSRWWLWPLLLLLLLLLVLLTLRYCATDLLDHPALPRQAALGRPSPTPSATAAAGGAVVDRDGSVRIDTRPGDTGGALRPGPTPAPGLAPLTPDPGQQPPPPPGAPPADAGITPPAPPPPAPDTQPSPPDAPATPPAQPAPTNRSDAPPPPRQDRPQDASPPGTQPAPPGTPLTIPKAAVDAGSTEFLNGKWRSITGLQDRKGNPVEINYDFEKGQGTVSLHRSVGGQDQTCTGRVGSTLKDGRLQIDQRGVRCPDGSSFQDSAVQCTVGTDKKAVCIGMNTDGTTYDVNIVK